MSCGSFPKDNQCVPEILSTALATESGSAGKSVMQDVLPVCDNVDMCLKLVTRSSEISPTLKVTKDVPRVGDNVDVSLKMVTGSSRKSLTQQVTKRNGKQEMDEINVNTGRAYIINNKEFCFKELRKREGSEIDTERITKVLEGFGMETELVQDPTLSDIKATMEKVESFDFKVYDCIILVIMSHGFQHNTIAAKDGAYSLDTDIMYPVLRNETLKSKLKFIITQGCKGTVNPLFHIEGTQQSPTVIPSEILQLHSCVEGYVSYLSITGSLFIKTLCDHLEQSGIKNILDIANTVVAAVKDKCGEIQIPMVHTNLTKKYIFGRTDN